MMAIALGSLGIALLATSAAACGVGSVTHDAHASGGDGGGSDGGGGAPDGNGLPPDARPADARTMVYVGGGDDKIHVFVLDPASLALTPAGTTATGAGPSFLAFDAKARWLVAVNEGASAVESFRIDAQSGALTRADGASSQGAGPAHIGLDRSGAWVLVANYDGGTAAVLPISATGGFGAPKAMVAPGMNAHEIVADAANKNLYVPCLGSDYVARYSLDAATGMLTARPTTASPAGAGPRHIALHPNGKFAYVMNEHASTISTFSVATDGSLSALGAAISTLPGGFSGTNTGAEIVVHPSGKFVYSSNRGDDSIAIFSVGSDGKLTSIGRASTGGKDPRHFSLVLGGTAILAANQTGGNLVGFHLDATSGLLTSVGTLAQVPGPEFVGALDLPR